MRLGAFVQTRQTRLYLKQNEWKLNCLPYRRESETGWQRMRKWHFGRARMLVMTIQKKPCSSWCLLCSTQRLDLQHASDPHIAPCLPISLF